MINGLSLNTEKNLNEKINEGSGKGNTFPKREKIIYGLYQIKNVVYNMICVKGWKITDNLSGKQ